MRIDGDKADDESLCNLSAGQSLCKQMQHIHLTRSKPSMQRRRPDCCRIWSDESLLRQLRGFWVGKDVCQQHCSSFDPGSDKDLFPGEGACSSNCPFIGSTLDRPDGSAYGFSQGFCRAPETGRLYRLSLCCKDTRTSFQTDENDQLAADLPGYRKALLV